MLLRNVNERLQIISRKDCKSEVAYNQKLFKVRVEYMQKFKSIILIKSSAKDLYPAKDLSPAKVSPFEKVS